MSGKQQAKPCLTGSQHDQCSKPLGIALLMLLKNIFPPIPSEVMMPLEDLR